MPSSQTLTQRNMVFRATSNTVRPIGNGVAQRILNQALALAVSCAREGLTSAQLSSDDGTLSLTIRTDVPPAWTHSLISNNSSKRRDGRHKVLIRESTPRS